MSIHNIKVRLNLDKEADARAYQILCNSERSMSKFVIAAVNAYGGYLSAQEEKEQFLFAVNDSLRKTLQEMFGAAILGTPTLKNPNAIPIHGSKQQEQSGEMADDFLKNFL